MEVAVCDRGSAGDLGGVFDGAHHQRARAWGDGGCTEGGVFLPLLVVGREGDWEDSLPFSLHVLDPIEGHLQHHKVVKVD